MILWYSGCGNSRFVADTLSKELGDDSMIFIPEAARQGTALEFGPDEVLGIVFPVYSWSVPKLVSEFLRTVSIKGKPSYIFAACTCGDQTGLTYEHLCKDLSKQGLQLDAFFSFQMPETYINLPGFSLDTPENAKRKIDGTRESLREVIGLIKQREAPVLRSAHNRPQVHGIGRLHRLRHLCQKLPPAEHHNRE